MADNLPFAERLLESMRQVTEALESDQPLESVLNCRTRAVRVRTAKLTPQQIRRVRHRLGASQTLFAQFLGVSPATVKAWEQGVNQPSRIAVRFLSEIEHDPEHWHRRLHESLVTKKPS